MRTRSVSCDTSLRPEEVLHFHPTWADPLIMADRRNSRLLRQSDMAQATCSAVLWPTKVRAVLVLHRRHMINHLHRNIHSNHQIPANNLPVLRQASSLAPFLLIKPHLH